MAVKTDVVLLADAGDVTVARRTAFYTYGKFEVILPEGREQQETDNRIEDGYIARAHDGNVGRFDFGFIRADATVNIDAGTSDLETQIDSAELRAEGDVFFEGDITPSGFNGFIPGVDYGTGDIVTVRRWGTSLALPVTSIELEVSESAGTRASRVHVSGQLIHDAASRRRSNDDLRQQIAAEKRERLRQVGAVDSKATQAKDTADEAKTTADEAKQATADNRTYIDEQLEAAGAAVEQGRQYLLQMEEHVAAGNAAAGQAEDLASQAAAAAAEAVLILDQLDPLRDDVTAAHAEVARLHDEASQFTAQAADHVQQASQHAATAKGYAQQALEHEEEGRRQATAALNSAGAASDSAAAAQSILDDADGILTQVSGYSQEAKDALNDAESLLANAGGQGKSLGDVLLEVAQKHQETLTAHNDILDLHGEVLQKHSEAIRYVAVAAAQASTAAMHAAQAAQEALNVAADAARAAGSAADAAGEAAQAASNNSAAIGKLQEADGKLQEADEKLQQQIDVLEDSQRLLANAVQILAGAVAQAAMAANEALNAAQSAGDAADSALDAIDALGEAVKARDATITSNSKAIAILKYEAMRFASRMSVEIDPNGQNKPAGIGNLEKYGTPISNEFISISRAPGVRTTTVQSADAGVRTFHFWDFDIELKGNWTGVITWEADTSAVEDYTFRAETMVVIGGEFAGARAWLDNPANANSGFRPSVENRLKRTPALTTGGIVNVKVYPEYIEGETDLTPYMP